VLDQAVAIVEGLAAEWDPESYTDCYRERLKNVIDRKRKGAKIEAPKAESEPKSAPDLMAALEATLERVKAGDSAGEIRDEREEALAAAAED
jgi:DNA end-binding protein Ku